MAQIARNVVPEEIIFDAWTSISYKRTMGNRAAGGNSWMAPMWVGDHARRLQAYKILQSYVDNASRYFLDTTDENRIKTRREYGDANIIVESVMDSVIGDDWKLVIEGVATGDARARDLQEWLIQWSTDERFGQHLLEAEQDAVSLGDGVYVVSWSNQKGRPRIQTFDPGFYFPVLNMDDASEQDYPTTVHIAWEEETDDPAKIRVRRITWRLGEILPQLDTATGEFVVDDNGVPLLTPGDSRGPDGQIFRQYSWNDEPVPLTCYMTDATWLLDKVKRTIDDFSDGNAMFHMNEDGQIIRNLDLLIDFVPVVHLSNTVAVREHYGKSSLSTVLQVLDDLQGADTDLQATSAILGNPPIAVKGGQLAADADGKITTYGPGTVYNVDAAGGIEVLDTSNALKPLSQYVLDLLARLSVNSRVPESVLGRIKPSEVPSGIALALSFGPLEKMVRKMRISRSEKYPILLKFVLRLALLGQAIPAGDIPAAALEFGSFLPSDKATTVQVVTQLRAVSPPLISLETALQMLIEAGFPIDDAAAELQRIEDEAAQAQQQALDTMKAQAEITAASQPKTNALATKPEQGSSAAARGT